MRVVKSVSHILALTAALATANVANAYSEVVTFGDSLSDRGIVYTLTGGAYPPAPYYNGHFSNGPVAVEWLAAGLGLPLTDLAVGGAQTGTGNKYSFLGATGIQSQIGLYSSLTGGVADSSALYVVWGGPNDFDLSYTLDPTTQGNTAALNVTSSIAALYSLGARHFLVPNAPDLSLTPQLITDQLTTPGAQNAGRVFSETFASSLGAGMGLLQYLAPDIDIHGFDTLGLSRLVVNNPTAFGFTNVTDACFSGGVVCSDPDSYLYWDELHPTAHAQAIIGAAFFATVTAVPEPKQGVMLIAGLAIVARTIRKRMA